MARIPSEGGRVSRQLQARRGRVAAENQTAIRRGGSKAFETFMTKPSSPQSASVRSTGRQPLNIGIVGLVSTISELRAQVCSGLPGVNLVALSDLDVARARTTASRLRGVRTVEDPYALIADPEVDGVVVGTPCAHHERFAMAAMEAGKHVLCEKPLAPTVAACERLVAAADKHDVRLGVSFHLRQTLAAQKAKQLVDSGALGRIDHVRAFHGHSGTEYFGPNFKVDASTTGGGTLMDGGNHFVDMVRWFLGDVERATGVGTEGVWKQPGCEDNGYLLLQSADGRVGTLHASWTEWRGYRYQVEVYGETGYVRFGYSPLWLTHASGQRGERMRAHRTFFPVYQVIERLRGWRWSLRNMLRGDLNDWVSAVAKGVSPAANGRDGLEAVRWAQCLERRSTSGETQL